MQNINNFIQSVKSQFDQVSLSTLKEKAGNFIGHKITTLLDNDLGDIYNFVQKDLDKSEHTEASIILLRGRLAEIPNKGLFGKITSFFMNRINAQLNQKELEFNTKEIGKLNAEQIQLRASLSLEKAALQTQKNEVEAQQHSLAKEIVELQKKLVDYSIRLGQSEADILEKEYAIDDNKTALQDADASYNEENRKWRSMEHNKDPNVGKQQAITEDKQKAYLKLKEDSEKLPKDKIALEQERDLIKGEMATIRAAILEKEKLLSQNKTKLETIKEKNAQADQLFEKIEIASQKEKGYQTRNLLIGGSLPKSPPKVSENAKTQPDDSAL